MNRVQVQIVYPNADPNPYLPVFHCDTTRPTYEVFVDASSSTGMALLTGGTAPSDSIPISGGKNGCRG